MWHNRSRLSECSGYCFYNELNVYAVVIRKIETWSWKNNPLWSNIAIEISGIGSKMQLGVIVLHSLWKVCFNFKSRNKLEKGKMKTIRFPSLSYPRSFTIPSPFFIIVSYFYKIIFLINRMTAADFAKISFKFKINRSQTFFYKIVLGKLSFNKWLFSDSKLDVFESSIYLNFHILV